MRKLRGEITVFLSLMLLIFLGFFAVLIEGIRVRNAKTSGERALNLGMSSAFAEYYRPLWEEYHLFGVARTGLEERVKEYMVLDYGLMLEELVVEEVVWGTDYEGQIFLHQAEAYEKYRVAEKLLGEGFAKEFTEKADKAAEGMDTEEEMAIPEDLEDSEEGWRERRKMGNLKALWSQNILKMVLDKPEGLSKKKLKNGAVAGEGKYSLSSTSPKKNLTQVKAFLKGQAAKQAELLYYQEHFKSYCKKSIGFQKEESLLDYEMEYLLEGKESDRDNMEAWLGRLLLARTALNYLSIYQDSGKSNAAYEMAFAALGFTGLAPLVQAGQQFILLGWGYEEALLDLRVLLKGGSVSLWKGKEEFSIRFDEVFRFSKELLRTKAEERLLAKVVRAMDYERYLSLFLGFKKEKQRRQAAWNLIDGNIRLRYQEEAFSLEDTVFGVHMKAQYFLPGRLGKDWHLEAERHYAY